MKISKAAAYALHAMLFMVRHSTQLPITTDVMSKAEGIPPGYLAKIFQRLVKGRLVKAVKGRRRGYVFARPPEEISLMELFETVEGEPLFDDCLLRHCECNGTPQNCTIYGHWVSATSGLRDLLKQTTVAAAAWNHPEHRFYSLPESLGIHKSAADQKRSQEKSADHSGVLEESA